MTGCTSESNTCLDCISYQRVTVPVWNTTSYSEQGGCPGSVIGLVSSNRFNTELLDSHTELYTAFEQPESVPQESPRTHSVHTVLSIFVNPHTLFKHVELSTPSEQLRTAEHVPLVPSHMMCQPHI